MTFEELYSTLNEPQRLAVDTHDGPVAVLAKAGTGKTQVLALRIASMMLSDSQINPENILALTFTDAGCIAMRERLISIIGTQAYKVNIYTFHSFCNHIIHSYGSIFGMDEYRPASELEQQQVLRQLIDELTPDNPLFRSRGDRYYEAGRLIHLFNIMRDEDWTAPLIEGMAKAYIDDLPSREEYIYKRNGKDYKKGDLKQRQIDGEKDKMALLVAGANLFSRYMEIMRDRKLYDFADMIHFVSGALSSNEYLQQTLQERHQYIMVDEFQDTNGAQNDLIKRITGFWDRPNIFVVGDDSQCIYAFSGAQIRNILKFHDDYNPAIVMMSQNYRSNQLILDAGENIIANNNIRLAGKYPDLDKRLTAAGKARTVRPVVWDFESTIEEEFGIAAAIKKKIDTGVEPSDICVLYRKHKQVDGLVGVLKNMEIPVNMKRKVNVLTEPVVLQLIDIMKYVMFEAESYNASSDLLFRILQYRAFGIDREVIHGLWIQNQFTLVKGTDGWMDACRSHRPLGKIDKLLDKHIEEYHDERLYSRLISYLYDFGIFDYWRNKEDGRYQMMVMNSFVEFVRSEVEKSPLLSEVGLIDIIDTMNANNLIMPLMDVNFDFTGVNLSTVHGSKGLEWKHVYVIGAQRSEWEKSRGSASRTYKFPDNLTMAAEDGGEEESRRLFYVAVTRAAEELVISYASADNNGKVLERSQFVDESGVQAIRKKTAKNRINKFLAERLTIHKEVGSDIAVRQAWEEKFIEYRLSPSHLNTYLRCPTEFFYRVVLRVSERPSTALIIGNAFHKAMEAAYSSGNYEDARVIAKRYIGQNLAFISETEIFPLDHAVMEMIERYRDEWEGQMVGGYTKVYPEFKVRNTFIGKVPIKSDIDRLALSGNDAAVFDYKTGNIQSAMAKLRPPSEKDPFGGEYWRQGKFYAEAINSMHTIPWKVKSVVFELITPVEVKPVVIEDMDHDDIFNQLITDTYNNIRNMTFDDGCGECLWCKFKNNL